MTSGVVRTMVLRVAGLAILLLLVLVGAITVRTLGRLPDTVLYFVESSPTSFRLEPAYRRSRVRSRDDEAFVRAAIAALAAGPDEAERARGLVTEVPPDVAVRGVRLDGERLYLDLGSSFGIGGGAAGQQGRLYQLLYTVTQPTTISEVVLSLDGFEATVFGSEGLLLDLPWRRSEQPGNPSW